MDKLSNVVNVLVRREKSPEEIQAARRVRGTETRLRIKNAKLISEGKPGLDNVPAYSRTKGLKDMTPEQKKEYHATKYLEYTARQKKAKKALEEIMDSITNKMSINGTSLNTSNPSNSEVEALVQVQGRHDEV